MTTYDREYDDASGLFYHVIPNHLPSLRKSTSYLTHCALMCFYSVIIPPASLLYP
ncbi:uncharacterized protein LAESUDRAFT_729118 [Laetiporus sulphureus 93-53]|uniref:Uncharacterized protein n=1 Tax=Laetiporus sulphureus 93-53 TaxID=1314785 RepID=A0A165CVU9_9APHY|nr:uncharacterized protein LAESUDRAFT_729118 [Laetiporus sulphureus 93-53]KZT03531.1 hypothetical protein LAESUDRAFT_729118 [Laetiporus sulphureus 93-53]